MEKDIAQNVSFVTVPIGGRAGDDDALCVNHFAHHSAGTVSCGHQRGAEAKLSGSDFLKTAKEHVG